MKDVFKKSTKTHNPSGHPMGLPTIFCTGVGTLILLTATAITVGCKDSHETTNESIEPVSTATIDPPNPTISVEKSTVSQSAHPSPKPTPSETVASPEPTRKSEHQATTTIDRSPPKPATSPVSLNTPLPVKKLNLEPTPTEIAIEINIATVNAIALASSELQLPANGFAVHSIQIMDWPDTSLGCPKPGVLYREITVPGWLILLDYEDTLFRFHADESGDRVITCDTSITGPAPMTVDVVNEAGISNATSLIISNLDQDGYKVNPRVLSDSSTLDELINALSEPTSLTDRDNCRADYILEFHTPESIVIFEYRCQQNGNMIRGKQDFWKGQEGITPIIFRATMSSILANKPFPAFPPNSD